MCLTSANHGTESNNGGADKGITITDAGCRELSGVAVSFLGCFSTEGSHPSSASFLFECTEVNHCDEEGSLGFLVEVNLALASFSAFNTQLPGEGAKVRIVIDTWLLGMGA